MASGPFYNEGKHGVEITDVALGESKTGNPQIVMRVRIVSRLCLDSAGEEFADSVPANYERTIYLTVTDRSRDMILAKLRWAGWHGDKFETIRGDLMGKEARAMCLHENSMSEKTLGQLMEKWDLELPPRDSKPLENKPMVAKKLNALFGKTLKEGASAPAPAGNPPAGDATGIPEEMLPVGAAPPVDEVPF